MVNTDSAVEYATLQDGTLTVASGQTLTLDGVTLDNVILWAAPTTSTAPPRR